MSDSKSNVLENQIIQHLFGGSACTKPTEWWLAVYNSDPTDTLNASSPVPVTNLFELVADGTDPIWTIAGNQASNRYTIQLPPVPATQTWVLSHFAIFDSDVAGRPLYHGSFRISKTLEEGDILLIASGQLVIREF